MSELRDVRQASFAVESAKERLDETYKQLAEACQIALSCGYTLEKIAQECGRTRERIRQIVASLGERQL
jgi:DNA-directed RNA polymerase sigma subunit (sigma70/sigma32)